MTLHEVSSIFVTDLEVIINLSAVTSHLHILSVYVESTYLPRSKLDSSVSSTGVLQLDRGSKGSQIQEGIGDQDKYRIVEVSGIYIWYM